MKLKSQKFILWFREISAKDVLLVGGKNASLGEMFSNLTKKGINIPDGFATTSKAYWYFLVEKKTLAKLKEIFRKLDVRNIKNLQETGRKARNLILKSEFPEDLKREIIKAYRKLGQKYGKNPDVAVRSSATAEDLPRASFAGLHETYLNIRGEKELLEAVKKCIASLFNDRAISYREEKGFSHFKIALSVGVQKMVRSDLSSAGVMFTIDTETGFKNVVLINGSWGLGEMVVKGKVIPDEFLVFKPTLRQSQGKLFEPIISKNLGTKRKKLIYSNKLGRTTHEVKVPPKDQKRFTLTDEEVLQLAKWAVLIEDHYSKKARKWLPQDIEWAKDGKTDEIFIVQSRPETVHAPKEIKTYTQYILKERGKSILEGGAIGSKITSGKVKIILDVSKIREFKAGEILVTKMTDPDWEPIMKIAKGIITEEGGRTCHGAIVSRELGIPCIVGAKNATSILKTGRYITIDCSGGQKGKIFEGQLKFEIKKYNLKKIPKTKTKIMINTSHPDVAFSQSFLPNSGVGLAREEFIIASQIQIHPLALYHFDKLKNKKLKRKIEEITVGYDDKKEYFIDKLSQGIGKIAAAFWPKPVIVRFSDFKSNEYAQLIGGEIFEPEEANPMLGFRGASRYYDEKFKPAFQMECKTIKRVREKFGLKNVKVMIPFCRTPEEGEKVLKLMREYGLERGKDDLEVYVMSEIPSNVVLADEFLEIFDGMSIGSNDLTQLILGIDRDSALVAKVGDERNEAVKEMIAKVIQECKKRKKYCGICGEAPSYFPDFAKFLVEQGIESMSLNPDTVIKTTLIIAKEEKGRK